MPGFRKCASLETPVVPIGTHVELLDEKHAGTLYMQAVPFGRLWPLRFCIICTYHLSEAHAQTSIFRLIQPGFLTHQQPTDLWQGAMSGQAQRLAGHPNRPPLQAERGRRGRQWQRGSEAELFFVFGGIPLKWVCLLQVGPPEVSNPSNWNHTQVSPCPKGLLSAGMDCLFRRSGGIKASNAKGPTTNMVLHRSLVHDYYSFRK